MKNWSKIHFCLIWNVANNTIIFLSFWNDGVFAFSFAQCNYTISLRFGIFVDRIFLGRIRRNMWQNFWTFVILAYIWKTFEKRPNDTLKHFKDSNSKEIGHGVWDDRLVWDVLSSGLESYWHYPDLYLKWKIQLNQGWSKIWSFSPNTTVIFYFKYICFVVYIRNN